MVNSEDRNPEADVKPDDRPRFMKAIAKIEEFLKSASNNVIRNYFDNPSDLAEAAQNFDFNTGSTGAYIQGDTRKLIITATQRLQDSIARYQGPPEIAQIYADLYFEPIKEILGQ